VADRTHIPGIRAALLAHRAKAVAEIADLEQRLTGLREYVRGLDEALPLLPERRRRRAAQAAPRKAAE
jgi:hypothetical protein